MKYRPETNVLVRQIDEETVLIHLGTDRVLHTNATGSRIWELLIEGCSRSDIVARLADEYRQDGEKIEAQISQFVADLLKEGLIARIDADASGG